MEIHRKYEFYTEIDGRPPKLEHIFAVSHAEFGQKLREHLKDGLTLSLRRPIRYHETGLVPYPSPLDFTIAEETRQQLEHRPLSVVSPVMAGAPHA